MKLRTLVKIGGGLVALIIITLIALPLFISADFLKAQLIAQVKKTTGRELVIKGKTSLSIFPNIEVSAEDVTLGNPAGFQGPYFAQIGKLKTGAALQPLLAHELNITGITLESAKLNLEQNAAGAKNWEFTAEKAKEEAAKDAAKSAAAPAASPLKNFALGDVSIKDSQITYSVPNTKPMSVSDIHLTLSGADGASPLKLDGSATYQKETVKAKIGVDSIKDFLGEKSTKLSAAFELPGASIQFAGHGSLKDGITAQGALEAGIRDLPKLLLWATGKPATGTLPKSLHVKTTIALQGAKQITLSDLVLDADDVNAKGKLAVDLTNAVPSVRGALQVGALNLDHWTKPNAAPATASSGGASASNDGWSNAPIDLSALRAANVALDLTIASIHSGKLDIGATAANIALNSGVLKVSVSKAALYSGNAQGVVTLDGSGNAAGLATELTITGVQIEPLVTALSGQSRLQGTANLNLAIRGNGISQRAIVSTLSGNGAMKVADGAFKGVNLAQFWRNAKQGFLFAQSSSESTDFTELSASFTIAQGIVSNRDLAMKSPALRLAGQGTVNLPARTVNYTLTPTIAVTSKGQGGKDNVGGLAVPVNITGPWSNPQIIPDVAVMIQEGLKNPEALKQNLKDIKGTLKEFNSPKDLKRALLGGGKTTTETAPATTDNATPATEAAPTTKPKSDKQQLIEQGLGGLLQGLQKK